MRGIDLAFQRLQPVAFLHPHGNVRLLGRNQIPFDIRQRRQIGRVRAHIGPDDAVTFPAGIGRDPDLVLEPAPGWLGRHVDHRAGHVDISSRDRRSANRNPRCGRTSSARRDARRHWRSGRRAPRNRGTRPGLRPATSRASAGRQRPDPSRRRTESSTAGTAIPSAFPRQPGPVFHYLGATASAFLPSRVIRPAISSERPACLATQTGSQSPQRQARRRGRAAFADHMDDHLDPPSLQQMKRILQDDRFGAAAQQFRIGDAADPRPRLDLDRFRFQKIRHAQIVLQPQTLLRGRPYLLRIRNNYSGLSRQGKTDATRPRQAGILAR